MLPSNKIKVRPGCEWNFFPPNRNSAIQQPRVAPPSRRLCFPNLQIWALKWHHFVTVYFLLNLTLSFWAPTTCLVQPLHRDTAKMSWREPCILPIMFYLGGLLIFSPPTMHHGLLFFPRKHLSSQEMGIYTKVSLYIPSAPAHFFLESGTGCPGAIWGQGGRRRRSGTTPDIPFRTSR